MNSNIGLREVLLRFEEEAIADAGCTLQQRKALQAITRCRSGELGHVLYRCPDCEQTHVLNASCGNRHCPLCQGHRTIEWVQRQEERKLPCGVFLLTFTVPQELRELIYSLQGAAYTAMFNASAETLRKILADPRYLGAKQLGFTSCLHTWGGQLQFHPHIHVLLPAGGLSQDGTWINFRNLFAAPVKAMSKIWRAALLSKLEGLVGRSQLPSRICSKNFNIDCRHAGDGKNAIRYLSRYAFKAAISNSRIEEIDGDHVVFRYKDRSSNKIKRCRIKGTEFVRRFMQHILPSGFMRIRHYGFNHPNSNIDLNELRKQIIDMNNLSVPDIEEASPPLVIKSKKPVCSICGGLLKCFRVKRQPKRPVIPIET